MSESACWFCYQTIKRDDPHFCSPACSAEWHYLFGKVEERAPTDDEAYGDDDDGVLTLPLR